MACLRKDNLVPNIRLTSWEKSSRDISGRVGGGEMLGFNSLRWESCSEQSKQSLSHKTIRHLYNSRRIIRECQSHTFWREWADVSARSRGSSWPGLFVVLPLVPDLISPPKVFVSGAVLSCQSYSTPAPGCARGDHEPDPGSSCRRSTWHFIPAVERDRSTESIDFWPNYPAWRKRPSLLRQWVRLGSWIANDARFDSSRTPRWTD